MSKSPTSSEWQQASQLIKELDFIMHEVYGEGPYPNGLIIPEELRSLISQNKHQPARWADELWG